MRLAISNIAWPAEAEAMVAGCLAGMGAQGVEVAPTKVWPRPLQATDAEVSAYRSFWERAGLPIVALQALLFERPALRLFADPGQRAEMLEYLTGMIRLAARLGASTLVFGSPKNRARGDLSPAQAAELAVPFFRELGRIASAEHTDFCIEPNPTAYGCDFITSAGEGIDLVNAVDQPGFGLHLDAAGMKLSEDPPAEVFLEAKPRWRHFHVSEPFLNPVGQRGMDHGPYAAALRQSKYDRWISIEMKVPQDGFKLGDVEHALHHVRSTYMAAA